jgi:hypothetical protein
VYEKTLCNQKQILASKWYMVRRITPVHNFHENHKEYTKLAMLWEQHAFITRSLLCNIQTFFTTSLLSDLHVHVSECAISLPVYLRKIAGLFPGTPLIGSFFHQYQMDAIKTLSVAENYEHSLNCSRNFRVFS